MSGMVRWVRWTDQSPGASPGGSTVSWTVPTQRPRSRRNRRSGRSCCVPECGTISAEDDAPDRHAVAGVRRGGIGQGLGGSRRPRAGWPARRRRRRRPSPRSARSSAALRWAAKSSNGRTTTGRPASGRSPRSGRGWRRVDDDDGLVDPAQADSRQPGRFSASSFATIRAEIAWAWLRHDARLPRGAGDGPDREIERRRPMRPVEPAERGQDDPEVPADVGVADQEGERSEPATGPGACQSAEGLRPIRGRGPPRCSNRRGRGTFPSP